MMVKTRFAPSPTGYLHIGGARTALYSWLHTRKHGGRFVLRIEDTDQQRSTEASVNAILEGMTWLGLDYDEGPFYQTQRFARYKEVVQQLVACGHAYHCYCSREELDQMREGQMQRKEKPRYDGRCRDLDLPKEGVDPVIRFRNPTDGEVVIHDLVKGQVVINNSELDDLIIARSDGTPTYNLTVVIDDLDMGVSVVIRGDDHLNNTPRQINILSALEADIPAYAHLPMILGADGKRLSKRHGAVSVMQYKEDGYLPEALLNYLVRLGWSSGDQEIFSVDEMLSQFDVADVNKSASTFNAEKLLWVNHQHIMNSDAVYIANQLRPYLGKIGIDPDASDVDLVAIVSAQRERTKTLVELAQNCAFYFQDVTSYNAKAAKKAFKPEAIAVLRSVKNALENLASWQRESIHQVFEQVVTELDIGFGKLGMPLRLAVTGGAASPDLDLTVWLIGKENVLSRIDKAICYIDEHNPRFRS